MRPSWIRSSFSFLYVAVGLEASMALAAPAGPCVVGETHQSVQKLNTITSLFENLIRRRERWPSIAEIHQARIELQQATQGGKIETLLDRSKPETRAGKIAFLEELLSQLDRENILIEPDDERAAQALYQNLKFKEGRPLTRFETVRALVRWAPSLHQNS